VGRVPAHRPQFVGLLVGVTIIVSALTYFPVLALAPLAEGL
jgi:K+-transporting ATPase ATPase A chain